MRVNGDAHIVFFAKKDISVGVEIRFDYNGHDMPWRQVCTNCLHAILRSNAYLMKKISQVYGQ